ncbi:hypothetical protein Tsubulata_044087 [Turnera subulata]|uniref:Protein kinase domain-containing protein n=1 Tax=Turnera subulata TaxID=218843 RepID=A0A9Q0JNJ7_9ROSI|nr:hypothetical protein Tsubulata_044087 [Turnera subulata]
MYKVSDSLFSCDSLQQLSLVYCRVAAPAGQICMKSLRTLYLRQVLSHDNTIENLISDPEISVPNIKSLALASVSNLLRRSPWGIRDELGFPPSFAHDRMVRGRIIPKVRGRENGGPFKSFSKHLRNVRIHCEEMDYELVQLVGLVLKTARNLEKIVFSPTPTSKYKKIFRSLPAASPRAVILFAIPKQFVAFLAHKSTMGACCGKQYGTPNIRSTIERYQQHTVEEAITRYGEGSEIRRTPHGAVSRARLEGGQDVVVKGFNTREKTSAQLRIINDQFTNELMLLTKIHHRNIVKLIGYGAWDGGKALVLEYFSRGSLTNPLGVAKALRYLHDGISPPIVHSDIKLDNILLTEDNTPKVIDFGGSVELVSDVMMARASTEEYAGPELEGQGGLISTAFDVHCLGIVMLELMTGRRAVEPGVDDPLRAVVKERADRENDDYQDFRERVLPVIAQGMRWDKFAAMMNLIKQCIRNNPDERPNINVVVQRLDAILDSW